MSSEFARIQDVERLERQLELTNKRIEKILDLSREDSKEVQIKMEESVGVMNDLKIMLTEFGSV